MRAAGVNRARRARGLPRVMGWEPLPAHNGRGTLKRLLLAIGVACAVPALIPAQDTQTADQAPAVERVDERTLLLDGSGVITTAEAGQSATVSPFGIWDLLRMILVLACVIGLVYGVFFLLKRANRGKFAQNDTIKVIGSQALPGNRGMYLVEVGSQVFLVGAGGDSVTLISEITDKETVDSMVLRAGEVSVNGRKSFGELVSGIFRGSQGESLSFMREQRERLRQLRNH